MLKSILNFTSDILLHNIYIYDYIVATVNALNACRVFPEFVTL